MKWKYSLLGLGLLLSLSLRAEFKVDKSFKRVYSVNKNTSLYLENKYGDLDLKNWDKDSVKIVCNYYVEAKSQEKLDRKLKALDFKVYHSDVLVRVKTELEGDVSLKYALIDNGSIQVNYTVYLPKNMPVKLKNRFGDIQLGNRSGQVDVELSHGDLILGILTEDVDLKLGNVSAFIQSADKNLIMTLKYCDEVEIKKANVVHVISSSSNVTLMKVEHLHLSSKRDRYQVQSVREMSGSGFMTKMNVLHLEKSIVYECQYGKYLNLNQVSKEFTSINLDLKNTDLQLNLGEVNDYSVKVKYLNSELIYPKNLFEFESLFPEEKHEYTVSSSKVGGGKRPISIKSKNSSLQFIKY